MVNKKDNVRYELFSAPKIARGSSPDIFQFWLRLILIQLVVWKLSNESGRMNSQITFSVAK